jgi:hypothetical protein
MGSYTQLKTDVTAFSHRNDLSGQMDTFVALAESVINKDLRVMEMEVIASMSFTDAFTALPTDYLETRDLYVDFSGARRSIELVPSKVLNGRYSRSSGSPRAYSIHGGKVELRPAPSVAEPATGEWSYIGKVPSLISNITNDVLDSYPLIYLAGMLVQVALFAQDDTELGKWVSVFDEQIRTANKVAGEGRYVRPSVRVM